MLEGLDDVDWASYDGAYGPCTEAPGILRAIADADPQTAGEGRFEFGSSIWHQGTVYPVTVAVVPFLIDLAVTPGVHRRDHLLRLLGDLCDPEQVNGADQFDVHATIAVHSGPLLTLLAEPDPGIRACAAYAAARSGPHSFDALRQRWAVETHPLVRAALLPGLALHDPASLPELLRRAADDESDPVRAAAALAAVRAGLPLSGAPLAAAATAFIHTDDHDQPWRSHWSLFGEVCRTADAVAATTMIRTLADSGSPRARLRAAYAMSDRFRSLRSAPGQLMPSLRDLLADTDPEVRQAAVDAAAHAGMAARPAAADLTAIALAGAAADHPERDAADAALGVLIRLGHPGHREALLACWASGRDPVLPDHGAPVKIAFDPAVLTAARRRLAAHLARQPAEAGTAWTPERHRSAVFTLIQLIGAWGPAAADAVPELTAALPAAPAVAAPALADIGPSAHPALASLADRAHGGDLRSAHAILRLTGDAGPLVAAGEALLARQPRHIAWDLTLLADAGRAAAPLVPALLPWLSGTTEPVHRHRYDQIAAARVAWRATGDPETVLPTLRAVLHAGFEPAGAAADLVAELGAGHDLVPDLRKLLGQGHGRARTGAAGALWRLGVASGELTAALVTAASDPYTCRAAVDLLVEMRATGAAPELARLAARDERLVTSGIGQPAWADDDLRHRLHSAVATLTA